MNRKLILILLAAVVAVAATALYAGWFHRDTALQGSGTVEARNIRVGSKIGGRIDQVLVREGDSVQPGQVLITFDDKELQASLEQSRANAEKSRRGYRPEEIAEARATAAQAKADYELKRNGYRQEDIASAQAELDRAKADEIRTYVDLILFEKRGDGSIWSDKVAWTDIQNFDDGGRRSHDLAFPEAGFVIGIRRFCQINVFPTVAAFELFQVGLRLMVVRFGGGNFLGTVAALEFIELVLGALLLGDGDFPVGFRGITLLLGNEILFCKRIVTIEIQVGANFVGFRAIEFGLGAGDVFLAIAVPF